MRPRRRRDIAVKRIFVGDIQGCCDQLERLLDVVKFRRGRDVLIPVGDMVNKGPASEEVVRLCMRVDAQPVLGNHDLEWLARGGSGSSKVDDWLSSQPIVRVFDDVLAVHAGLHPEWKIKQLDDLSEKQIRYATTVRYVDKKGNQAPRDWPPPGPPYRPWDDFYRGRHRVIFGHWARRGLVVRKRCVGLDTGCVYGGKLSAWIAEDDRVVQVPGWKR